MSSPHPPGEEPAPPGSRIAARLAAVRATFERVVPVDLATEVADGALLVDLRPAANRELEGELPGAVAIERIHLEWRLDATSGAALDGITDDRRIVLFCNEGYSSSLAAADLHGLGLVNATDLVGGYRGWRAHVDAGRPVARIAAV